MIKHKTFYKLIIGDHLYKLVNDYWKYEGIANGKKIKALKENPSVKLLDLR